MLPSRIVPRFLCLLLFARIAAADPVAELAEFSAFPKVDLADLARGKIVTARSPAMSNPRHLSVQACYLVRASVPKTVELLKHWNATEHPQLKVHLQGMISQKPAPDHFSRLTAAPAEFIEASLAPKPGHFQIGAAETRKLTGAGEAPAAVAVWSQLLAQRASSFVTGGLVRQPPYENEAVRVHEEAAAMLREQPRMRARFASISAATPLGGGGLTPTLYWDLFEVEGDPHVSLGALYGRASNGGWQGVDITYFASGGFFIHVSFHEFWPVEVDNAPATLVWRGDLLSSASLASLRGIERSGAGTVMMRKIQKTAALFQKDAAATR
ncbi:MAG: hypothetical protein V4710_16020 [Verrucomicrobiota bacterium]